MHWQSGDRVYLRHTDTWGTILRLEGQDMAIVRPEGDRDAFPVHLDDLAHRAPDRVPAAAADAARAGYRTEGTFVPGNNGVFLAVSLDSDQSLHRQFQLALVHDEAFPLAYELTFDAPHQARATFTGSLPAYSWRQLAAYPLDILNDHPEVKLLLWRQEGHRQTAIPPFQTRLKAKNILTRQESQLYLSKPAAFLPVPTSAAAPMAIPVKTTEKKAGGYRRISHVPNPVDRAAFETILDLHIEKLVTDPRKLTEAEIFQHQMMAFDQYLSRAVRLGVDRVFVIHGLGKGRLRDTIRERCDQHPYVLRSSNDHHPMFGFGATEITFFE